MDDEKMLETQGEESGGFMAGFEETEPAGGGGNKNPEYAPAEDAAANREEPPGDGGENPPAPPLRDQGLVRDDVRAFIAAFPDAARDFGSIPPEVWAAVRAGTSLTAAYARYSGAQAARAEEAALRRRRQDARNAAASTGSMRSAGGAGPRDPFLQGLEEG